MRPHQTRPHELVYDSAASNAPLRGAFLDLYHYRALLRLLVGRELTVRYKRSLLGVGWTLLNPLLTATVMWIVFNKFFRYAIPGNIPYIVYLLAGVLAVTYLQQGVANTGASMTAASGVLTKVYVPPIVFAFSTASAGAVNFVFGLAPLVAFQLALGVGVAPTFPAVLLLILLLLSLITGAGLLVAVFSARYHDVRELTNVLLFLVSYLTPTFYPIAVVPASYRRYFLFNPMYSFVESIRYVCYGGPTPPWYMWAICTGSALVALVGGTAIFTKRWPTIAILL